MLHREVFQHQCVQHVVQHLVRRQRVAVELPRAKFRSGRTVDDPLRNRRRQRVPVARQAIYAGLGAVLQRRETARHVAVQRRVSDRVLALVAGRQHQAPLLVRDRHEQHPAAARLDVLLGDVLGKARKQLRKRVAHRLHHAGDGQHFVLRAQPPGLTFGLLNTDGKRVAIRHHDCEHAIRAQGVHGQRKGERRVDPARKSQNDVLEAALSHVVTNPRHERAVDLLVFRHHGGQVPPAGPCGRAVRRIQPAVPQAFRKGLGANAGPA